MVGALILFCEYAWPKRLSDGQCRDSAPINLYKTAYEAVLTTHVAVRAYANTKPNNTVAATIPNHKPFMHYLRSYKPTLRDSHTQKTVKQVNVSVSSSN